MIINKKGRNCFPKYPFSMYLWHCQAGMCFVIFSAGFFAILEFGAKLALLLEIVEILIEHVFPFL